MSAGRIQCLVCFPCRQDLDWGKRAIQLVWQGALPGRQVIWRGTQLGARRRRIGGSTAAALASGFSLATLFLNAQSLDPLVSQPCSAWGTSMGNVNTGVRRKLRFVETGKHGGGTPPGPAFPAPFPAPRRADSPPARTQGPLGGVPRAPGRPSRRAIPRPPRCSVPACPRDLCASLMAWGAYWNGPGGLCARGNRPAWRATDTPSRPQSSPHSSSSDANHDACEEISGQTGVGGQPQLHLMHFLGLPSQGLIQ